MKAKPSFVLAITFFITFVLNLYGQSQPKAIKAYLSVRIAGKALQNKEIRQAEIADKVKDILASEGIQVIPEEEIEKPGESNVYIYVMLKDSLRISGKRLYDGGNYIGNVLYPNKSYAYKTSADVTSSVKQYIRENITANAQKSEKQKYILRK